MIFTQKKNLATNLGISMFKLRNLIKSWDIVVIKNDKDVICWYAEASTLINQISWIKVKLYKKKQ